MSKRGSVKKVLACILSFVIIGTIIAGIFAYNKNDKFKSKINNIFNIEQKDTSNNETLTSETTNSNDSDELKRLKQQLKDTEVEIETLEFKLNSVHLNITTLKSEIEELETALENSVEDKANIQSQLDMKVEELEIALAEKEILELELENLQIKINQLESGLNNSEEKLQNISNPNWVLNANFRINQRGSSTYTRAGEDIYTVDRWGIFKGNGTFTVLTHTLEATDETSPTVFGQWIEDAYFLKGKTITASATVDGVRYSKTITLPETFVFGEDYINNIYECDDFVFRIYFYVDWTIEKSVMGVQFLLENGKSITIDDVKVEESAFETKFTQRSTVEDLTLCQRYYQALSTWSLGYALSTSKIVFFAPTVTTMRTVGKVTVNNPPSYYLDNQKITMDGAIKLNSKGQNGIQFTYTSPTAIEKYSIFYICVGNIAVDGEYYTDFVI